MAGLVGAVDPAHARIVELDAELGARRSSRISAPLPMSTSTSTDLPSGSVSGRWNVTDGPSRSTRTSTTRPLRARSSQRLGRLELDDAVRVVDGERRLVEERQREEAADPGEVRREAARVEDADAVVACARARRTRASSAPRARPRPPAGHAPAVEGGAGRRAADCVGERGAEERQPDPGVDHEARLDRAVDRDGHRHEWCRYSKGGTAATLTPSHRPNRRAVGSGACRRGMSS